MPTLKTGGTSPGVVAPREKRPGGHRRGVGIVDVLSGMQINLYMLS